MYEWFHHYGDLKKNYKRYVKFGMYFDKASQHCPILGNYRAFRDEICNVLESNALAANHSPLLSSSPW